MCCEDVRENRSGTGGNWYCATGNRIQGTRHGTGRPSKGVDDERGRTCAETGNSTDGQDTNKNWRSTRKESTQAMICMSYSHVSS